MCSIWPAPPAITLSTPTAYQPDSDVWPETAQLKSSPQASRLGTGLALVRTIWFGVNAWEHIGREDQERGDGWAVTCREPNTWLKNLLLPRSVASPLLLFFSKRTCMRLLSCFAQGGNARVRTVSFLPSSASILQPCF